METVSAPHGVEVKKGDRFEFGKNWRRFLSTLNEQKIALAEQSLKRFLDADRLDGKTFLDVGSGSGLYSLAARRLGAHVRSFDFDPKSVACTKELRHRFFPHDEDWVIECGSILDREFLDRLGEFDIVYSWGVLHHTGAMRKALENVKQLVKSDGQLYIAIYNDLGEVTDEWREIKRTYNHVPYVLRLPYALRIIVPAEMEAILTHLRRKDLGAYVRKWTEYPAQARGMSKWYDWIDWIGGFPYECATIEQIVDFFGADGFALELLGSRGAGIGCNEFVFRRTAARGVVLDNPLPQSRLLWRQFGRRLSGPIMRTAAGYLAKAPDLHDPDASSTWVLFCNGQLAGTAELGDAPDAIVVAPSDWTQEAVDATHFAVIRGTVRLIDLESVSMYTGFMYGASFPDLVSLADNRTPSGDTSPVFVYEGSDQLEFPHSLHDQIVRYGAGRFSHWGEDVLFSTSDNTDPRTNGRVYRLVIADRSPGQAEGAPKLLMMP
jgi:2-polyprenyl-6-hydroxyphenyl methylase/3-demethylubiquinone-9 3-methyltransferase